ETPVARFVTKLKAAHEYSRLSDRELLWRFTRRQEEAAFAALVDRHASMVLRVCRRTLADEHDAEDVFQATFLVLLKKARALRWRESIACWLHDVAYRLSLKGRSARLARSRKERQAARTNVNPADALTVREAQAVLHEELQ